MNKKIISLLLVVIGMNAQACLCIVDIQMGFTNVETVVSQMIKSQSQEISSNLIPEIKKNTEDLKSQNDVYKKIIKGEREKAIQNREIIFLLKKLNKLQ